MSTAIEGSLIVVYQTVSTLVSYPHNARTHSNHQLRQIACSITEFGFTNPILIDQNNTVVAGHGRLLAAQMLGMDRVPTIRLETLTQSQIRAYVLADNQLALNAGWDKSTLAIEFEYLLAVNDEIDITVTGFEMPEIDLILQEASQATDPEDELSIEESGPAVTHLGDLWQLGKHRCYAAIPCRKVTTKP
jgi:ParB-like chromosome segregation protein Spo0J